MTSSPICDLTDLDSLPKEDTESEPADVDQTAQDSTGPMTVEVMEPSAGGSKRRRTILRQDQVDTLQQMFYVTQNPGKAFREKLSLQLCLSSKTIQVHQG